MHCDEFRQRLMIDPLDTDPVFRGHASVCPDCAAEAERALAFEARLRAVLAQDAHAHAEGDATGDVSSDRRSDCCYCRRFWRPSCGGGPGLGRGSIRDRT